MSMIQFLHKNWIKAEETSSEYQHADLMLYARACLISYLTRRKEVASYVLMVSSFGTTDACSQ